MGVADCMIIDDRYLECTGNAAGSSDVTLTVTDVDNQSAEDNFKVSVEDNSNNNGNNGGSGGSNNNYNSANDNEGCVEIWQCAGWSACVNGTQSTTCVDLNECGTEHDKPVEVLDCGIVAEVKGDEGSETIHDEVTPTLNEEEPTTGWNILTIAGLAIAGLIVLFLIIALVAKRRSY